MILHIFLKMVIATAWGWTDYEKQLYFERRFVELEQRLVLKSNPKLSKLISDQRHDIAGCKEVHEGRGGASSLFKCIKFMNREDELSLFSPKRELLISDLNNICRKYSKNSGLVNKAIKEKIKLWTGEWKSCHSALWRQVYSSVYEAELADPIKALSILKRARQGIKSDGYWSTKAEELFK